MIEIISKGKEIGLSDQNICKIIQISKNSYYYNRKHHMDKTVKGKPLLCLIEEIFYAKRKEAGIRSIAMILQNKYGISVNLKKTARIKKEHGLIMKIRKNNQYNIDFRKVWNTGQLPIYRSRILRLINLIKSIRPT